MAKAPVAARIAILARGTALMALIANSTDPAPGALLLTQDEGAEVVSNGHAVIDTTIPSPDPTLAAVRLTDAGAAILAAAPPADGAAAPAPAPVAKGFEIEDNVAMPADAARKSRDGGYPFDKLNVGQSFHVATSAENPDPVTRLQSSVSGARAKYSVGSGTQETVTVRTYKKAEAPLKGFAKGADGKRIVESEESVTREKMNVTRDFTVKAVDASDPKGVGARVWRTA